MSISIHALLAESDGFLIMIGGFGADFYPRSPCGERQHAYQLVLWVLRFLSTLSLRRATRRLTHHRLKYRFLSTLSLRRATSKFKPPIQTHRHFYPRSPCGERRNARLETRHPCAISIHALLAESDEFRKLLYPGSANFYPRSPCGERQWDKNGCGRSWRFLSTLSLRRATTQCRL